MEPMSGIEPESGAYHAPALPLSYTDKHGGEGRSRTHDELLVGQPIYR